MSVRTAGETRRVDFDPVTRVGGALAFQTTVDGEAGRVLDASAIAPLFRGYEVILEGRDPRDAIFISSRACGVCGGVHATASALACEMAFGIQPPPMGIVARNLLVATEYLYDHPTHLFTRVGPDFAEPVVRETSPELWERALRTAAPGGGTHGFALISDLMIALTPFSGRLYAEALGMSRRAREAYVLLGGKYPHPQTIVPGGVSATVDVQDVQVALWRVTEFFDYAQKVVAVWDDLIDFFLEADPRLREVGEGPRNFIDLGQWDDPLAYDGAFESASAWAERRWATPGAIIDGRLRTTDVQQVNMGVEEFVDHSFYEDWVPGGDPRFHHDPVGKPLSARHPANKETIPQPGETDTARKYSWSTAPRWEGHPMETGAYARLWMTALARKLPHRRFIEPTGHGLRLAMPRAALPGTELEWRVPERWGALERNRAQAYALAYSVLVAYENLVIALDLLRKGGPDSGVFTHYQIPKDARHGTGLWGGARGYLSHHMTLEDRVIQNYQILAPSTFTMSPRDARGHPGPCEAAVLATPLLSTAQPERGIDVLRTIRSFDPCMSCATH
ncbi:MAG: nickel-dependent hydrogenase large subunit [Actinomycetota bacterium]|nr:nickel-dependent hydrogenase large subunit [Actinomycetota bacterium]MDQ3647007.1 nickel-dependent hydrogenase large subunit [Actinomycetota bacterium]